MHPTSVEREAWGRVGWRGGRGEEVGEAERAGESGGEAGRKAMWAENYVGARENERGVCGWIVA
jgi:hypothetical protein